MQADENTRHDHHTQCIGDFELPRVTDCDDAGHCHDWASGQYIDNFAGATVNWVSI